MKKTLTTIALAAIVGIAGVTAAAAQTVKVGFAAEPFPPFTSPDANGEWVGWEVDFQKAICAEAKLDCVITPVPWDGIIPALTSKKIDMIVGLMSITDARLKTIDFSDKYYNAPTSIIGSKDHTFDATPEGLAGKTIGVQIASVHQDYAEKYFSARSTIKEYQTQDEAYQDLAAGRLDAVEVDRGSVGAFLATDQGKECCEIKGDVKDDPAIFGAGAGIGLRKGDSELKEKINAAIKTIRANGTYNAITKKYFDYDVYGN